VETLRGAVVLLVVIIAAIAMWWLFSLLGVLWWRIALLLGCAAFVAFLGGRANRRRRSVRESRPPML
jgi:hypothetical protein